MPQRKGLVAPQNRFLDTIATRFCGTHSNFVLGNAQVRDYPIVYCSDGLIELTGFNRSQIMSRCCSCNFLWGDRTSEEKRDAILNALDTKQELQIEVYFKKRCGDSFLCLMDIVPIKNDKSQVVLFLVSHKDITSERSKTHGTNQNEITAHGNQLPVAKKSKKRSFFRSSIQTPPSYLSAGLATTITAAALGTTAFRNNKLLDYLNKSKSQLTNFHPVLQPNYAPDNIESNSKLPLSKRTLVNKRRTSKDSSDEPTMKNLTNMRNSAEVNYNQQEPQADEALIEADSAAPSTADSSTNSDNNDEPNMSTAYKYERRRSRAVLFHLTGKYDQNAKRKTHLKQFQTIPEYKVQDVQASRLIILHFSLFKIIWDWLILLCTFYIAIMVPYNAAFHLDTESKDLIICDIIVEILFIVDIILNFLTTFVSKSGQVVHDLRQIAIHYLKGWFFLDMLAAIPFDVIHTLYDGMRSGVGSWIPLLKLARLLRLARLFQKIERYSQYSTVILGLLICMFFLIAHWFACGWYWLGREEMKLPNTQNYSWLSELGRRMQIPLLPNETSVNLSERAVYVSSLYFTTTSLTSVGFGNVSPNTVNEKIFSIIAMLIGALMHAAVFGNVTTLIQRMYARRSAYQTKNQDLKDFTRAHHIPKPLKQRMLEFFQAMWAINRGIDKEAIMQSFPENVRGDIALHLNREILSLPMFKSASPGCRKCLAQSIRTRFATPGEYLINQGDVLRDIFFVCSGSLEILDSQGTVVGLLGKCDIFGSDIDEYPTLGFSAYDVKSLTYCELQTITLDPPFQQLLELYPQFKEDFAECLREELSFNIREGFDPTASMNELPAVTLENIDGESLRHTVTVNPIRPEELTSVTDSSVVIIEDETTPSEHLERNDRAPIDRGNSVKTINKSGFDPPKSMDSFDFLNSSSNPMAVIEQRYVDNITTHASGQAIRQFTEFKRSSSEPKLNQLCAASVGQVGKNTPSTEIRSPFTPQSSFPKFMQHQLVNEPIPVDVTKFLKEIHTEFIQMRKDMNELSKLVRTIIQHMQSQDFHGTRSPVSKTNSRMEFFKSLDCSVNNDAEVTETTQHASEEWSPRPIDNSRTTEEAKQHSEHRVVKFQLPQPSSHAKRSVKSGSVKCRSGCLKQQGRSSTEHSLSCDIDFSTTTTTTGESAKQLSTIRSEPVLK